MSCCLECPGQAEIQRLVTVFWYLEPGINPGPGHRTLKGNLFNGGAG
jgi:hypothetical protein